MKYVKDGWLIITDKVHRSMWNPLYWIPFVKPYREVVISKTKANDYNLRIPKATKRRGLK